MQLDYSAIFGVFVDLVSKAIPVAVFIYLLDKMLQIGVFFA